MNTFEMRTVIHFGDNSLDRLRTLPYKRVLVISGPIVVQSGMIDLITAPLQKGGITYDLFYDVVPDAPVGKISEGVQKFLEFQPEAVVAVGGGGTAFNTTMGCRMFAGK
ncbi:MAG: iron-containing alcohol dehydrogenase [Clostridiales bacterium]|nr:iron-containing alcohol dehydrogenase [Clostridiales bacterium]